MKKAFQVLAEIITILMLVSCSASNASEIPTPNAVQPTDEPSATPTIESAPTETPEPSRDVITLDYCNAQRDTEKAKIGVVNIYDGDKISTIIEWTGGYLSNCYTQSGPDQSSLYDDIEASIFEQLILRDSKVVLGRSLEESLASGQIALFFKPDAPLIGGVYMPELSPSDVGLPVDPTTNRIAYDPCYLLDTEKMMWHAGDGWAGKLNNGQPQIVYAPISGRIVSANYVNEGVKWGIIIATFYSKDGKQVFYDVVHTEGLVDGLSVGSIVQKGDPLAFHTYEGWGTPYWIPGKNESWTLTDIGFRNGPAGANASLHNFAPYSYFNPMPFYQDDFEQNDDIEIWPVCKGNPISPDNYDLITPSP